MMDEGRYGRWMQYLVIGASAFLLLLLGLSLRLDQRASTWKTYQQEYAAILEAETAAGVADHPTLETGIYQVELPQLGTTDRCISCHLGLEEDREPPLEQPHSAHPGGHLLHHPMGVYGCTVCHGGQGEALGQKEAFARDAEVHWAHPLLEQPYLQSSCGKCHLTLFSSPPSDTDGMEMLLGGKELFAREGCLGCHQARGVGGILGPDLTAQGEKTHKEYSFRNVAGEQSVSNWLKEHFRDPEMVSPGSRMLKIDLPEEDLDALATLVMGLSNPDFPVHYYSLATLGEFKGQREKLEGATAYGYLCAACHGKEGEGKDYEAYASGVAAIGNVDFLRVASKEFIRFTMDKGRSGRQMSTWAPEVSGISDGELSELARFVDTRLERPLPELQGIRASAISGAELYGQKCETCHGEDGKGGLAVSLKQKGLLARADHDFLLRTIFRGRDNTAMPAWWNLEDGEIADLLALMTSWRFELTGSSALRLPSGRNLQKGDPGQGEMSFRFLCFRCHGSFGEGDTGPAIINRSFLAAASDTFLYETISKGREGTAMFGWLSDISAKERIGEQDIANVIAWMRREAEARPQYLHPGSNPGQSTEGERLYRQLCLECHGTGGEGDKAPALNRQEFLSAATNGYLYATITLGRTVTKMPAWGYGDPEHRVLTKDERDDLVAYLRSMQRIQISY